MAALLIREKPVAAYGVAVADVETQPGCLAATGEAATRQKPRAGLELTFSEAC